MANPIAIQLADQIITQATTWRTYNVTIGANHTQLTTSGMSGRFAMFVSNPTLTASIYIGPQTIITSSDGSTAGTLDGPNSGLWIQPANNYNRLQLPAGDGLAIYAVSVGGASYVTVVELARTPTP